MDSDYNFYQSKLIQWVVKYSGGLIKDEKEAERVILIFIGGIVLFSIITIFTSGLIGKERIPERYKFDPNVPTKDIDKMPSMGP